MSYNKRMECARVVHPTRKSVRLLLAAHSQRYVFSIMELPVNLHPKRTRRSALAKVAAPLLAFVVLAIGMVAPMLIFMLFSGMSLESEFPEDKGWLLIVGCGIGPGLAYLTYRWVLISLGDFEEHEADGMWNGKRKNT